MKNESYYQNLKNTLCELLECNSWYDTIVKQARAVFTTICIAFDFQADTVQTDTLLREVYTIYTTCNMQNEVSYEEFEETMLMDIV